MRQARQRMRSAGFVFYAIAVCGVLAAVPATAIEFRGGQHVVVGTDEVILDDLYVTGETVTVDGKVEGDVIASGREVRMNGEVTGDLMACGQAVVVNGRVGDDIRMAGMALQLGPTASVGDDVVAAGFSLETNPESLTRGSLLFAGFQALLAGGIDESLQGSMNAIEIRGGIGGDSEIEVEGDANMPSFVQYIPSPVALPTVPGGLTIADTARIDGGLEYTSSNEARGSGVGAGTLTRKEPASAGADAGKAARKPSWPGRLFKWLGLIVLGLLLAWWIPGWLNEWSDEIQSRPLPLAGVGLMGVAALPVGIVLALVVLVVVAIILGFLKLGSLAALALVLGMVGLGLLILLFWLTSSYLAPLLVGLCTGRWVLKRFAADKARGLVLPLVAGLVLLALLRFVPFLGFLVAVMVLLLGWGAILLWLWKRLRPAEAAV
ncbi:MAG: polymer-forming cytoskeletal protein [bacterium]|nr:polymer-forming cytoskeletal protein [bacterium]